MSPFFPVSPVFLSSPVRGIHETQGTQVTQGILETQGTQSIHFVPFVSSVFCALCPLVPPVSPVALVSKAGTQINIYDGNIDVSFGLRRKRTLVCNSSCSVFNISVSLAHICCWYTAQSLMPFNIILAYTNTFRVNAFRSLLVLFQFWLNPTQVRMRTPIAKHRKQTENDIVTNFIK